ncbi:related to 1-acyldihydroxyacetone-phosphate reductase [Cephalotrichum gorgonifer]|uniref:Related to 1-acyldihydroxyacetone-phosphate reductase n=1 Tax=Cephalotrichum gorgonifer TaxID=2041049 RepID=A0AAE8N4S6_9PEZI|nr:related to 1-acyldihydroxyacetone-phosphate reductase [Cephalotrichum gorgonifer]
MPPQPGQKTALITGCTPGGIGHALALQFHKKGVHVVVTARRPEVLKEMADMGMTALPLDVTDAESIAACKEEVSALTGGKLDFLVNNAGLTHTVPATDIVLPDVRNTFETNVFAIMAMVQAFIPLLSASRGLIVNISSLAARTPYVFGSVYCATKAAVDAYSRTLRLELAPLNIRVMVAVTGTVRSNIASRVHRSLLPGSPYEVVRDVFEWRLTYSQNHGTMSTDEYARGVVDAAMRGEGWFGGLWGGSPKWYWGGGFAGMVWLASWFGEWLTDMVFLRKFRVLEMAKRIQEAKKTD